MSEQMTGAQATVAQLAAEGVRVILSIPGIHTLPICDVVLDYPQLRFIHGRHEQGIAFMANGYARASGEIAVSLVITGPGVTNSLTPLADAYLDSVPVVAITGQVARPFIGKDSFQETDITGITLPVTKHNYLVLDVNSLAGVVKQAFHLARTGRPGSSWCGRRRVGT